MKNSEGDNPQGQGSGLIVGGALALFISLVLLFIVFFITNRQSSQYGQYLAHAGELRILSQTLASDADHAAAGNSEAFSALNNNLRSFEDRWGRLTKGDPSSRLPPAPKRLQPELNAVQGQWDKLHGDLVKISGAQLTVVSYHQVAEALGESAPQIQHEYEELASVLEREGATVAQVRLAEHQALLVERMFRTVDMLRTGGVGVENSAEEFGKQAKELSKNYDYLAKGGGGYPAVTSAQGIKHLREISNLSEFLSGTVDEIYETAPEMVLVRKASDASYKSAHVLLAQLGTLINGIEKSSQNRSLVYLGYLLGLFALAMIAFLFFRTRSETQRQVSESKDVSERNQTAILRLLDEIADLGDGDLTVQATVTEDFTGAIADSINYSIDKLRELVETINQTAVQVASATEETQATALSLAEASERQAREIGDASAAINEMALSIDQVSATAAKSSEVAERSVSIANKGNEVVHNTIVGMNNIREQIQDTSKRIKRLGESSQEIGDIIGLINDISEQTNVLALNAAIQASMAGESGRGFAVVADEVQRLAERSSSATKQIEVLVKTIQSDTNEAVISMEQTTSEVVRGANLAQDAGVALEEIEKVSKSLAELIESISSAAHQQAISAGNVSNAMKVILEITSQTSAGTTNTARSIGELAKLAAVLRESVSGFVLPDSDENR